MSAPTAAPPAGWYPDPVRPGLRYWDGGAWTEHRAAPLAPPPGAPVRRADEEAALDPDRPLVPLGVGLAATAGGVLALNLMGWLLDATGALGHLPRLLTFAIALSLEPLCLLTPLVVWARRSGTSFVAATSLRVRRSDLVRGPGIGLLSRAAAVPVAALVTLISPRLLGTNTNGVGDIDGTLAVVYIILAAVVIAPIVEEIAFRGALLPALSRRFGLDAGLVLTSALFGAAHFQVRIGLGNIGMVLVLAVLGGVLGWEARQRGRLGTSIIAHALGNGLVVAVLLLR